MLTKVDERQQIELPGTVTQKTIEEYRLSIARILSHRPRLLLLDCSNVLFASSCHVGLMWETRVDCLRLGTTLQLTDVSDQMKMVLCTLDLETLLIARDDSIVKSTDQLPQPAPLHVSEPFHDSVTLSRTGVGEGLDRFLAFLSSLRLESTMLFEFRLIYYEVVMNIRLHSGLRENDVAVIDVSVGEGGVALTFRDTGTPFDPAAFVSTYCPESTVRSGRVRGFGLILIHKVADEIEYAREKATTNRLTIVKKWGIVK